MKLIIAAVFIFVILMNCAAQDNTIVQTSYFSAGLKQIKECANFGLVFSGPVMNYGRYRGFSKNNRLFNIENEVGISIPFSKGIPAMSVYLKPAEISWLFIRNSAQHNFSAGPLVKFEYDYTLYPDLQSAFDYWFTNFSLGINSRYSFHLAKQSLTARLKISVGGFTSRQAGYRNPYFYDIGFTYAIRHLHSDLEFSTLKDFNTTNFELTWNPKPDSRFVWSYRFDYSGYFRNPAVSIITHNIKLTIAKRKTRT